VGSQEDPAHGDGDAGHSYILVDQRQEVVDNLFGRQLPAPRVDFLIDNAGFELVVDLATALYLLAAGMAEEVVLHVKAHPTFVSDAISADVRKTVDLLAAEENSAAATAGSRLEKYLASYKLRIETDFFWTSPLAMWQMPDALREDLSKSAIVISKGDANYRRLLGDRHWPFETPFEDIVSYMPTPVLALRALKSEVACGLRPSQAETTAKKDPEWLTDGRWGVIQFRG
jgi:hypothetical protein